MCDETDNPTVFATVVFFIGIKRVEGVRVCVWCAFMTEWETYCNRSLSRDGHPVFDGLVVQGLQGCTVAALSPTAQAASAARAQLELFMFQDLVP